MEYKSGQEVIVVGPERDLSRFGSEGTIGRKYEIRKISSDGILLLVGNNWHQPHTVVPANRVYIGGE